jgi:DNA-directed RNA polymerase specialized sigma24 family protein
MHYNWWTTSLPRDADLSPERICLMKVERYLYAYLSLRMACYLDCAMEAEGERVGSGRGRRQEAHWTALAEIKADLDRALGRLPRRCAAAVLMRYTYGYSLREIGRRLGTNRDQAGRTVRAGVREVVRELAGTKKTEKKSEKMRQNRASRTHIC